ncbi:MAG TPA: alpha-E domain-containing protein [Actinomycetales bacterium]
MLSRIAESLFWIGRYLERADGTARILDVHLQLLLEDPWLDEDSSCRVLLGVMGAPVDAELSRPVTRAEMLGRLAYDGAPGSIVGSLRAARENARRAREIISTEMWESLNTTHNSLAPGRQPGTRRPHLFFDWVRERVAVFGGIADSSMSRDQPWHFLVLGRSIERVDMTARMLASEDLRGASGPAWALVLRSCGAHEAFLRAYGAAATEDRAAEFMLLDRLFPRSVVHALMTADTCLAALDVDGAMARRLGPADDARRLLGRQRTDLEYRAVSDLLADPAAEMDRLQRAVSSASEAISRRYFPRGPATSWVKEIS